jgi:hypothetical protein
LPSHNGNHRALPVNRTPKHQLSPAAASGSEDTKSTRPRTGRAFATKHSSWLAGSVAIVTAATATVGILAAASGASPDPGTVIARDTFARTVSAGLGQADLGGAWTVGYRTPTAVSVNSAGAQLQNIVGSSSISAVLPSTSALEETSRVSFALPSGSSAGPGLFVAAMARQQADGRGYRGKVTFSSNGIARIAIYRTDTHSVETLLGGTGLSWSAKAGQVIDLEVSTTGSNPTVVTTRAWLDGASTPSAQFSFSDSSAARVASRGSIGFWSYRSSSTISAFAVKSVLGWSKDAAETSSAASTSAAAPVVAPTTVAAPTSSTPAPVTTTATPTSSSATPTPSSSKPTSTAPAPPPSSIPAPAPSSGQPGSGNTGIPNGTQLSTVNGALHITQSGTYSGLDIHGFVYIEAPNVTLKNSIIRGGTATNSVGLVNDYVASATNFVLQDSELAPSNPSVYIDGIQGANYTALRVNIHGTVDGAKMNGNNSSIKSSWIHDLKSFSSDPYQNGGPSHGDGVQVLGGQNLTIAGNNIVGGNNSALQVTQTTGVVSNLALSSNWLGGGTCTVNLQDAPLSSMSGISVDHNQFSHTSSANCAIIAFTGVNFTNLDNTWDDGTAGTPNVIRRS